MDTRTLQHVIEAGTQLSTMVLLLLLLLLFAKFFLATLFSLDLLGILLAALMRRYAEHHLALRPMAEALGRPAPYKRADRRAVLDVFERGLEASGIQPLPASPSPPGS